MNHFADAPAPAVPAPTVPAKRLNVFERFLTVWVALCMLAGLVRYARASIPHDRRL